MSLHGHVVTGQVHVHAACVPRAADQEGALKTSSRIHRASVIFGSVVALAIALPGSALADPPTALPAHADGTE
jgi:hypothetical protein